MDDDLQSASQSLSEGPKRSAYKPDNAVRQPKKSKLPFFIYAAVILIVVGGLIVWKLTSSKTMPVQTTSVTKVNTSTQVKNDVPVSTSTEEYSSTALSVDFTYPKSWKAVEASGGIRIESPSFIYNSPERGDITGNFRIYIRQGARQIDGSYIGKGIAIKPSEKLVYTQPAIGQNETTLLSFFGSETFEYFSFFMIVGNFQLNLGDTLGPDYGKEPDTYIVVGGYSTPAAIDDLATTPVTLDYYATTNAYKQALAIIASLQLR